MTFSPQSTSTDIRTPLEIIVSLSAPDMKQVDSCIQDSLKSDVVLINQIASYIVASGGKRLRPMLLTLCAHACGYQGQKHIPLAPLLNSSIRLHCYTMTWLMNPTCAVASKAYTRFGEMQPVCWWAIFCIPEAFK